MLWSFEIRLKFLPSLLVPERSSNVFCGICWVGVFPCLKVTVNSSLFPVLYVDGLFCFFRRNVSIITIPKRSPSPSLTFELYRKLINPHLPGNDILVSDVSNKIGSPVEGVDYRNFIIRKCGIVSVLAFQWAFFNNVATQQEILITKLLNCRVRYFNLLIGDGRSINTQYNFIIQNFSWVFPKVFNIELNSKRTNLPVSI